MKPTARKRLVTRLETLDEIPTGLARDAARLIRIQAHEYAVLKKKLKTRIEALEEAA